MMPERATPLAVRETDALRCAVIEIKSGNKPAAREFLKRACREDAGNVSAWLWRASLAETPLEAVSHLEQVLRINPKNATALTWISTIRVNAARQEAPAAEPPAAPEPPVQKVPERSLCPFCGHAEDRDFPKCPECRAINRLDPEAILRNEGVDERRLRAALDGRLAAAENDSSFDAQYWLGLAWLNLFHSSEALACLEKAARLRPADARVRDALAAVAARPVVMVVDDSVTIRSLITRTLERAAFRTLPAANGMEALSQLDRHTPDLVLLDVSMPVIDGYQICKAIKSYPKTRHVPVVMLSGNDGFFDKVKGRIAGAETYLTKPCEPATLLKTIREYVRQKDL